MGASFRATRFRVFCWVSPPIVSFIGDEGLCRVFEG